MNDIQKARKLLDTALTIVDDLTGVYGEIKSNSAQWASDIMVIKNHLLSEAESRQLSKPDCANQKIYGLTIKVKGYNRYIPHYTRMFIEDTLSSTKMNNGKSLAEPYDTVDLLLGTLAVESNFGQYDKQVGGGPAISPYQLEPKTIDWLYSVYGAGLSLSNNPEEIRLDFYQATIYARLRYLVDSKPIPNKHSYSTLEGYITALGEYWKRVYNTELGAGKVNQFVDKYCKYVLLPYSEDTIGLF